jgi:small neutral amino acid transporter SnatA (MarC family)
VNEYTIYVISTLHNMLMVPMGASFVGTGITIIVYLTEVMDTNSSKAKIKTYRRAMLLMGLITVLLHLLFVLIPGEKILRAM